MHTFFLLVLFSLLASCGGREVKLPLIEAKGIERIENHSSIWIFFEGDSLQSQAVLNKNNKLLNTHWIFNIDRRLEMGQVIPLLIKLQADRASDSMHKKEGMKNYFSFASKSRQTISLIPFDPIEFSEVPDETISSDTIAKSSLVVLLDKGGFLHEGQRRDVDFLQTLLSQKDSTGLHPKLALRYTQALRYEAYLRAKAQLFDAGLMTETVEQVLDLN